MGFARHRRVSRLPAAEGQIKYFFSKPSARSRISWPAKHTTGVGETYEGTISGRGALYTGEGHAGRGGRDTAACLAHSPFMSWMYLVVSKQGVSNFIGVVELLIALLLALRPISPRASFIGSLGAITTFLLTTSFLFSTPGAIQLGHGVEILGGTGQFLIKDLGLLGASFWTAAEALRAANARNVPRAV